MIRVLIVDDSELDRKLISYSLDKEKDIEVVAKADDPYMARELIKTLKPDVIILDLQMPRMDGLTFLNKIMNYYPVPVIIVSAFTPKNSTYALKALQIGAFETLSKPGLEYDLKKFSKKLVRTIQGTEKARIELPKKAKFNSKNQLGGQNKTINLQNADQKVIAIGSSTGGTRALENILNELPLGLPGIVIVQHLPESFTKSFADRLNKDSVFQIKEAKDNDEIKPNNVYIAPGNIHMTIHKQNNQKFIRLVQGKRVKYHRPSVDVLFNSVAEQIGSDAIGIILTGMGSDGAEGLLKMKNNGAFTIGQDKASSVVYGMPKVAMEIGAVNTQYQLQDIPAALVEQVKIADNNSEKLISLSKTPQEEKI